MQGCHGEGWCPKDHEISGTGKWPDGQKELGYALEGGSLGRRRIESGET